MKTWAAAGILTLPLACTSARPQPMPAPRVSVPAPAPTPAAAGRFVLVLDDSFEMARTEVQAEGAGGLRAALPVDASSSLRAAVRDRLEAAFRSLAVRATRPGPAEMAAEGWDAVIAVSLVEFKPTLSCAAETGTPLECTASALVKLQADVTRRTGTPFSVTDLRLRKVEGEAGASCGHCQALVESALAQSIEGRRRA